MASATTEYSTHARLLHVGFMVPLNDLLFENKTLEEILGRLSLRCNIYSASLFYKDSNQDTMNAWFEQRKRSSRAGYLRAYYLNKKGEVIIEMDVDGKQFYLIASSATAKPPVEMKKEVAKGLFGERHAFPERIQVPCFPYKYQMNRGFIECEAIHTFRKEQQEKKNVLESQQNEKHVAT